MLWNHQVDNIIIVNCINIIIYYINNNELPGELLCNNMTTSNVEKTCYLHMWKVTVAMVTSLIAPIAEKYTHYIILFFEYLNSPRFPPHGIHLSSSLILLLFHCLRWTQLSSKKVMRFFTNRAVFLKLTNYLLFHKLKTAMTTTKGCKSTFSGQNLIIAIL